MTGINKLIAALFVSATCAALIAQPVGVPYECNFQQTAQLPPEMKVLSGDFSVSKDGSNQFLELSPWPLNSFGLLLGPERDGPTSLRARIRSASTGARNPEFGIGLGGVGGYRLWLMPAIKEIQIRQAEKILARAPLEWTSGTWIQMHLEIQKTGESWLVCGKAWQDNETEPPSWLVRLELKEAPPSGRASLWGTPYSEKPIQFDDVRLEAR